MAGVGEASAIVGLIATGAKLSKAIIDIAGQYKAAKKQIEHFGSEIANLASILDQLQRLYGSGQRDVDASVQSVMLSLVDQCSNLFAELEQYKNTLYSNSRSNVTISIRGKAKWVLQTTEVQYLRTRVESMKTNILLMMTMHCVHKLQRYLYKSQHPTAVTDASFSSQIRTPPVLENAQQIQLLSLQSNDCVQRLHHLENAFMTPTPANHEDVSLNRLSITSINTADQVQSTRDSILSLYGHQSYHEKILKPRQADLDFTHFLDSDIFVSSDIHTSHSRASLIVEDYIQRDSAHKDLGANHDDEHDRDIISLATDPNRGDVEEGYRIPDEQQHHHLRNDTKHDTGWTSPPNIPIVSLRVWMQEPCYKVLPKALEYHKVEADWREYDLCLTCQDDEESNLALEDLPLVIFRIAEDKGQRPMFMLRKRASPHEWPISQPLDLPDGQPRASTFIEDYIVSSVADEDRGTYHDDETEHNLVTTPASGSTDHSDGDAEYRALGEQRYFNSQSEAKKHNEPDKEFSKPEKSKFRIPDNYPYWQVLPRALKIYNKQSDWRMYDLILVCGDEERTFALWDQPLLDFHIADKQGKSPRFIFRKLAVPHLWPGPEHLDVLDGQPSRITATRHNRK